MLRDNYNRTHEATETLNMQNLITLTSTKNSNIWTRFTMTKGSTVVIQASSKGYMVEIDQEEALARINTLRAQGTWKVETKILKAA